VFDNEDNVKIQFDKFFSDFMFTFFNRILEILSGDNDFGKLAGPKTTAKLGLVHQIP